LQKFFTYTTKGSTSVAKVNGQEVSLPEKKGAIGAIKRRREEIALLGTGSEARLVEM
jgi:hypothetical protein